MLPHLNSITIICCCVWCISSKTRTAERAHNQHAASHKATTTSQLQHQRRYSTRQSRIISSARLYIFISIAARPKRYSFVYVLEYIYSFVVGYLVLFLIHYSKYTIKYMLHNRHTYISFPSPFNDFAKHNNDFANQINDFSNQNKSN